MTTRRTLAEWHEAIRSTLDNIPKMGAMARETWGIITLLSQIAFILLDIREALQKPAVTDRSRGDD